MELIQESHAALFFGVSLGAWAMGWGMGFFWLHLKRVLEIAR